MGQVTQSTWQLSENASPLLVQTTNWDFAPTVDWLLRSLPKNRSTWSGLVSRHLLMVCTPRATLPPDQALLFFMGTVTYAEVNLLASPQTRVMITGFWPSQWEQGGGGGVAGGAVAHHGKEADPLTEAGARASCQRAVRNPEPLLLKSPICARCLKHCLSTLNSRGLPPKNPGDCSFRAQEFMRKSAHRATIPRMT